MTSLTCDRCGRLAPFPGGTWQCVRCQAFFCGDCFGRREQKFQACNTCNPKKNFREAALVRKIVAAVRKKYPRAYVRKIADRYTRGLPDLIVLFWSERGLAVPEAETLWVEAKAPGGRLSKIQEAEHESIRAAGGTVLVALSVDDVLHIMAELGAVP